MFINFRDLNCRQESSLFHMNVYLKNINYGIKEAEKLSRTDMTPAFWEGFATYLAKEAYTRNDEKSGLLMFNSADTTLSQCKKYFQSTIIVLFLC